MRIINVDIHDKIAVAEGNALYVCGNSDYIIHFGFDAEWDAYETKTARFVWREKHTDVVFTGTDCPMPIMSDTYSINVGVFAGDLATTTPAYIPAKKSILCGGGLPADPEPDVYNQVMEKLNETQAEAEKVFIVRSTGHGGYADKTQEEIRAAVAEGKTCLLLFGSRGKVGVYAGERTDNWDGKEKPTFRLSPESDVNGMGKGLCHQTVFVDENGKTSLLNSYAFTGNPYTLHVRRKNAETVSYGGRSEVIVETDILTSPNGTKYRLVVANDGTLTTEKV